MKLKLLQILILILLLFSTPSYAAFTFKSEIVPISSPLTTERIWEVDPNEPNPHRQVWALGRSMGLVGLAISSGVGNKKLVSAKGIQSRTEIHLRGSGRWFLPITEFPCGADEGWFRTQEESERSAQKAAEEWNRLLESHYLDLEQRFQKIKSPTDAISVNEAQRAFNEWAKKMDLLWRDQTVPGIRAQEWKNYLVQAKGCQKKELGWPAVMEPLPTGEAPKLLGQIPVRLWNGQHSFRMSFDLLGKRLNGKLLLDSTATHSALDPDFFLRQGIRSELLADPVKKVLSVDRAEIAGTQIPRIDFELRRTEKFSPPEFLAPCCDGIAGLDLFKNYVIGIGSKTPRENTPEGPKPFMKQSPGIHTASMTLWPRAGFWIPSGGIGLAREMPDSFWIEARINAKNRIESDCDLLSEGKVVASRVTWNTALTDEALVYGKHVPARALTLKCQGRILAEGIFPVRAEFAAPSGASAEIGMGLMSKGPMAFDIPHGRIWFDQSFQDNPIPRNASGVEAKYHLKKNEDRILRVINLSRRRPADQLARAGLKEGMEILEINGYPAEDLDLWQVNQLLAGRSGKSITVKWKTRAGHKMAPLNLD